MSNFTDNDAIIAAYHRQAKAKKLSGDTQGAIDDYTKIIKLKPNDIVSRINIGNIYYNQRQYEKALAIYNKVFSIISDDDDMIETVKENREKIIHQYVLQLLEQAAKEYESKNYNKVFSLTDKIFTLDCNNKQARMTHIKTKYCEVLGFFAEDETLKNLDILENEAINENNRNILGQIYEFRGNIAFENTKYREALNYFTLALEKGDLSNYTSNNLYIMRGRCYFALNQYKEALLDYLIACSNTQNDSINIYLNLIFDVYRENNEFPTYLYDIDLCEISPFLYVENLEYVLNHFSKDGKFELAIEIISTVLDYNEYEEDYHYFLKGKLYYKNKQYKEALTEFNTAIEFNSQNGDYFYFRGLTYVALKDTKNAQNDLIAALELTPDNQDYKYNLELINNPNLLNLKMCSKERFVQITGLSEEQADKFIKDRNNGKQYYDIESFAFDFELQPHEKLLLQDKLIFAHKPKNKLGRKIDI